MTLRVVHCASGFNGRKQELLGVGVRVKTIGPIRAKVYSVGLYLDRALAAARLTQRGFSDTDEKQLAGNSEFEQEVKDML